MNRICWAILSGEYPPSRGGVSDYTHQLAIALARRGDEVHIFAPLPPEPFAGQPRDAGVTAHWLPDHFGPRSLWRISETISRLDPNIRVSVQYVPHAFGWKAMNIPFCLWLHAHRNRWWIDVMFHEVAFPIARGQPIRHNFLGGVNRAMASMITRSARRIFVSIPAWTELIHNRSARWLPVPSNLPTCVPQDAITTIRRKYARDDEILIGHFGTCGPLIAPMLRAILSVLMHDAKRRVILIGRGGENAGVEAAIVTGGLSRDHAAAHIAACDLLIQPYPDGISSRRSSAIAAIGLSRPVVSAIGRSTELFWKETGAIALAEVNEPAAIVAVAEAVLHDNRAREHINLRAGRLYAERFDLSRTIDALRGDVWP